MNGILAQCLKLGNKGLDSSTCATEGGESGCADCASLGETCPVMCGLCDGKVIGFGPVNWHSCPHLKLVLCENCGKLHGTLFSTSLTHVCTFWI